MACAYRGLVPLPPLVVQLCLTSWAVFAPHVALCAVAAPVAPWWVWLPGALALAWRLLDPIAAQIWPPRQRPRQLCGIYGGSEELLGPYRKAVRRVAATYRPTPWLWSGDQRTLAVAFGGRRAQEVLDVVHVDGPRGKLVVYVRPQSTAPAPMVFVLGGIIGDPDAPFVLDLQRATKARGWGFGLWATRPDLLLGSLASAPDPADERDVHACLAFCREHARGMPVYMVGYSLGATTALMYCARLGGAALCDAAVSVAGAFTPDLIFFPHYRRYWQPWLTATLKLLIWERFSHELCPRHEVAGVSDYQQLVDLLPHAGPTSKLCARAFAGAEAQSISRPVLFFASADDPFHPIDGLGIDASLPYVLYFITEVGGHVSWPEGWFADCSSFHTRVVLDFFTAHLRDHQTGSVA